jgi:hypothetical protein
MEPCRELRHQNRMGIVKHHWLARLVGAARVSIIAHYAVAREARRREACLHRKCVPIEVLGKYSSCMPADADTFPSLPYVQQHARDPMTVFHCGRNGRTPPLTHERVCKRAIITASRFRGADRGHVDRSCARLGLWSGTAKRADARGFVGACVCGWRFNKKRRAGATLEFCSVLSVHVVLLLTERSSWLMD